GLAMYESPGADLDDRQIARPDDAVEGGLAHPQDCGAVGLTQKQRLYLGLCRRVSRHEKAPSTIDRAHLPRSAEGAVGRVYGTPCGGLTADRGRILPTNKQPAYIGVLSVCSAGADPAAALVDAQQNRLRADARSRFPLQRWPPSRIPLR